MYLLTHSHIDEMPVSRSRVLLVSSVIMFCVSYFAVRFPDFPYTSIISNVMILGMAVPSFIYAVKWLGGRRGLVTLLVLSVLPLLVEAYAVTTGIPYGDFSYSDGLGLMLFGLVPVSVSFAYLPMLLGAVVIASRYGTGIAARSALGGIVSVIVDLVIDPATVADGLWVWEGGGAYYGVPVSNYAGWLLTGTVYTYIFLVLSGNPPEIPVGLVDSLVLILSFWSGFLLWRGLWFPASVGLGLTAFCIALK